MPEIVMIACAAKNSVIGNGPDIPWSIKEDFKHFADLTRGSPCIMGDVTYESLPPKSKCNTVSSATQMSPTSGL